MGVGSATWGAFAGGQTTQDIGSGSGPYGNALFISHVQKSVVRYNVFGGAGLVQPLWKAPLPRVLVKALMGANARGFLGVLRALLFSK